MNRATILLTLSFLSNIAFGQTPIQTKEIKIEYTDGYAVFAWFVLVVVKLNSMITRIIFGTMNFQKSNQQKVVLAVACYTVILSFMMKVEIYDMMRTTI